MTRYVIDVACAIKIVSGTLTIAKENQLLAPTLMRSQVLDFLFKQVNCGTLDEHNALKYNEEFAKLKVRYLGDAVLRRKAWSVARSLDLSSTFQAEYVALTILQADVLLTDDESLTTIARGFVRVQSTSALITR